MRKMNMAAAPMLGIGSELMNYDDAVAWVSGRKAGVDEKQ